MKKYLKKIKNAGTASEPVKIAHKIYVLANYDIVTKKITLMVELDNKQLAEVVSVLVYPQLFSSISPGLVPGVIKIKKCHPHLKFLDELHAAAHAHFIAGIWAATWQGFNLEEDI